MALFGQSFSSKTVVGTLYSAVPTTMPTNYASVFGPETVLTAPSGDVYVGDYQTGYVYKFDTTGKTTKIAALSGPSGMAWDPAGNLIVSDRGNCTIRKITIPDGKNTLTTLYGFAACRYVGDGRKANANNTGFGGNRGIAFDLAGNLYIADTGAHRVRKIDTSGVITTVAGTGTSGFTGDGAAATDARLNAPEDVTIRGNLLYIADTGNNRLRAIDVRTGIINTIAGNGAVSTTVRATPTSGTSQIVLDGQSALNVNLSGPASMHFDSAGSLIFTDRGNTSLNQRIRKLDAGTGNVSTLLTYTTLNASDSANNSMAIPCRMDIGPDGRIYWADSNERTVKILDPVTQVVTNLVTGGGSGAGGPATGAHLLNPFGLAVDSSGNLYVSDSQRHQVFKVDAATGSINAFSGRGTRGAQNNEGVNAAPQSALASMHNNPGGLAADAAGNVYIADSGNNRIRKVNAADGSIITVAGGGGSGDDGVPAFLPTNPTGSGVGTVTVSLAYASLSRPRGVAVDASGNIYIADTGNHCVRMVSAADGTISTIAGTRGTSGSGGDGGLATDAYLNAPQGVGVDSFGNVYIADTGNHTVRVVTANYIYPVMGQPGQNSSEALTTRGAWTHRMRAPQAVATDAKGFAYLADTLTNFVRRYDPNTGVAINVLNGGSATANTNAACGGLVSCDTADNANSTLVNISYPNGVAVDQNSGVVYVSEQFSGLVRALIPK